MTTIADLIKTKPAGAVSFRAQITAFDRKETKQLKPYLEIALSDGTGELTKLKAWSDAPAYPGLKSRAKGDFVAVRGTFTSGEFGWESRDFVCEPLNDDERAEMLAGTPERREYLDARWSKLVALVTSLADPFLRRTCELMLERYGEPFRRAAAARGNHHVRRGGLLEHVTEMAELADAVCGVFPELNRSLLIAGVLFHDLGKIVENQYERDGFAMPFTERAELIGHIPIGFELARDLGKEVMLLEKERGITAGTWTDWHDHMTQRTLLHLRHLILAHHGEKAWGSPLEPRTLEAQMLHYIDQLSAKREMMREALLGKELAPGVHERKYPLPGNLVDSPKEPKPAWPPAEPKPEWPPAPPEQPAGDGRGEFPPSTETTT